MLITQEIVFKKIITTKSVIKSIGNNEQYRLDNYFNKLEYDLGCTYLFYIYEDIIHDKKIIYTSNWTWQNRLIGEELINECPIIKAGAIALSSGRRSIVLPWNNIQCQTSLEKDITLYRNEFNIANGIGVSHSNGYIREGIGLGADIRDHSFSLRLLENNLLIKVLKRVRSLALATENFQLIH